MQSTISDLGWSLANPITLLSLISDQALMQVAQASRETKKVQLFSLIYVSYCQIKQSDSSTEVHNIVQASVRRNASLNITGALLFTGEHFAQILEGIEPAVIELVDAIRRDPRHDQMQIIDQGPIDRRLFAKWSLAYFGPSKFVSDHVNRLLDSASPNQRLRALRDLEYLIREFAS